MKSFLFLLAVVAVHTFDHEKYMLKKWTKIKAFESCFGKDHVKMYMMRKKQAMAQCSMEDAPMLELPMFQSPYRTVGALVHSAYDDSNSQNYGHGKNDKMFDERLLQYFIEKAVKDVLNEDDNMDMNDFRMASYPPRKYFKNRFHYRRHQRDAEDSGDKKKEMLEIGDRLNNKLQELQEQMSNKINNFTCVMKKCGVLNMDGHFNDVEEIVSQTNQALKFSDEWLQSHIETDVRVCHQMADNLPDEVLDECVFGPDLAKVKCFKKCLKMRKLKTCMNFDIKQQLEENFAPLPELVKQTKMEEKALLPLVYELLHGDEKQMM